MSNHLVVGIILSAGLFLLVLLPRFNRWPEHEIGQYSGKPRDYISDSKYIVYSLAYLATFLVFALSLSQIENIQVLFETSPIGDGIGQAVVQLLGENSFAAALILLVALLAVPAVDRVDERWRGFLLELARVPREALELKNQLMDSLGVLEFRHSSMDKVLERLRQFGHQSFWEQVAGEDVAPTRAEKLERSVLTALYLVSLNKRLEPSLVDVQDLSRVESRLLELAAVVPSLGREGSTITTHEYQAEVDRQNQLLTEMLARYSIKRCPDRTRRYAELQSYGFHLDYVDRQGSEIEQPVILSAVGLLASCFVITMLGLVFFDLVGVSRSPGAEAWFEQGRIVGWAVGGWVSFAIAIGFGVFFNEILRDRLGQRSLAAYLLAFMFSTLGSCIFFMISRVDRFSPPFLWLAVFFGLLSAVTIASLHRGYRDHRLVVSKAGQLAAVYGLVSMVLQVLVHLSFRSFDTTVTNILAFALFGLVRGAAIAFLVAYLFLEFGRVYALHSKRKWPRVRFGRKVEGELEGARTAMYVKDISEQGALCRMPSVNEPHEGDRVRLRFDFADLKGHVIWARHHLARVRFNQDDPNLGEVKSFLLRQEGGKAA